MEYLLVTNNEQFEAAKILFNEYAVSINIDLSFQNFKAELDSIREMYGPPDGGIILCRAGDKFIACVAIRKIDHSIGELKRMYVQPTFQGFGVGKELLSRAVALAKECNYAILRLDTLSSMSAAIHLYKANGFYEILPYYYNPNPTAIFFEKIISPLPGS